MRNACRRIRNTSRPVRSVQRPVRMALCAVALGLAAGLPAGADSIEPSLSDARWSFEQHARGWMADLEKNEAANRKKAPVYSVADEAVIRFQGYGEAYETEVKPTGSAQTPFVGILRYKENVYTCLRDDAERCTVSSSIPVSEIFSFRNGAWKY